MPAMIPFRFLRSSALVIATLGAAGAAARPVITEVSWMGSDASAGDEWVELYNPDADAACDLGGDFVLIEGTTVRALPRVAVAGGAFFVLEQNENATPIAAPDAAIVSALSLNNSGEALCLCPTGTTACDAALCDIANPAGAWPAGSNTVPKKTMERITPVNDGALDASWQDGAPSSPGTASFAGTPGNTDACTPPPNDAGPGPDDAGPEPVVDAGPNAAPTISVSAPAGTVSGSSVDVVYSAADADDGDEVSVDLYWSLDDNGQDGVRFARGLPGGDNETAPFDTSAVPAGSVHVFAVARDTRGATAYAYAPGLVQIQGGGGATASLELTEPDGVNDLEDGEAIVISWDVTLPAGGSGAVSLFIDDDDAGEDGDPVAGGLAAGADGPRAFRLPLDGLEPGEHFIYGVLEYASPAGGGTVSSYAAAAIQVPAPGCSCTAGRSGSGQRLPAVATLAILLVTFARPKSRRTF